VSATIHYRNASKSDPVLAVDAPSSFIESLEKAFGSLPIISSGSHVDMLKGMGITSHGESGYQDAIDKIEKLGAIEIYASW